MPKEANIKKWKEKFNKLMSKYDLLDLRASKNGVFYKVYYKTLDLTVTVEFNQDVAVFIERVLQQIRIQVRERLKTEKIMAISANQILEGFYDIKNKKKSN